VRHVGERLEPEAGQSELDRRHAREVLRVRRREPQERAAGDVLGQQVHGPEPEGVDQPVQVLGRDGAGERVVGDGRVAEPAQVDGDDPVAVGQQRDEAVEGPPRLGEAVDEQDGRPPGPGGDVVQGRTADVGDVVADVGDGGAGGLDGHEDLRV